MVSRLKFFAGLLFADAILDANVAVCAACGAQGRTIAVRALATCSD